MEPTSPAFLGCAVAAAVAAPFALAWLLTRHHDRGQRRRRRLPALAAVAGAVVLAQVVAVTAVATGVNRAYGFFPTWGSLFGQTAPPPPAPMPPGQQPDRAVRAHHADLAALQPPDYPHPRGLLQTFAVTGAVSHLTRKVIVWYPPQYFEPAWQHRRFPVDLMMAGAYSRVARVVSDLHFAAVVGPEVSSGAVPPFVAVFPEVNVANPQDTECIDAPGGTQAFSWLDRDVPAWARANLRVRTDASSWDASGWSLGGYCAVKLHLLDPATFGSAVAIEGYFAPELDSTTGNLATALGSHPRLADLSSPLWLVQHQPPRSPHILLMTSSTDPQSYARTLQFLHAAHSSGVQLYLVPEQGHTLTAWRTVLPEVLRWSTTFARRA